MKQGYNPEDDEVPTSVFLIFLGICIAGILVTLAIAQRWDL